MSPDSTTYTGPVRIEWLVLDPPNITFWPRRVQPENGPGSLQVYIIMV
jgi:hypothetical protein